MSQKDIDLIEYEILGNVDLINPFPGLRPFGFEESHLFFGREGQSDEVLLNLAKHRFTAVIGASGSGKSSLMYCGLIPILYGGFMTQAGADWTVYVTRPGISPIDNLAETIVSKDEESVELTDDDLSISKTLTSTILRSSSMGLVDAIKQSGNAENKNIFILVDQFEELFRYINSEGSSNALNEAAAFVNLLIKSINQDEVPIYVALTMRSDFIGECSQFPELTHIINRSHYLIPQMTREQQRLAIEGPVAVGGGIITKRLVQQLLNDVGNNPDQLPVLQHALMRTWDYWVRNKEGDESIDLRHYIAVGRISEALSQHANEAYSELTKRQKEICEVLFKSLTEKSSDNIGIRRAAKLSDIAEISEASEEEIIEVVEVFRQPGRSFLMPPATVSLDSDSIIEISHESLMRIWQRLKAWVNEEAESANMYRRLSDAAEMYQVGKTGLWRPPDLQLALNWKRKQKPTAVWAQRYNPYFERALLFLDISENAYLNEQKSKELLQKRMLRRTKIVALVLGLFAIISTLFFVFGWMQKLEAEAQAKIAQENQFKAEQQREIAEVNEKEAIRNAEIADRERKIAEEERTRADRERDRAVENQKIANEQKEFALYQKNVADSQRVIATIKQNEAIEAQKIASEERDKALALRMLSISQSMAVKSLNITRDDDLKALLAQQAFLFNNEYGGNTYDNYIYDGLYYALRKIQGKGFNLLSGHKDNVRAIKFNEEGDKFYSTGSDGRVLVWDAENLTYQVLYKHDYINKTLQLSPDEKWLIVAGDAPYILLLDLQNFKASKISNHEGTVTSIVVFDDKDYFYSLGIEDQKLFRNEYTGRSTEIKTFEERLRSLIISPDNKYLIGGSESGELIVWDAQTLEKSYSINTLTSQPIYSLAINEKIQKLAVGDENGVIYLCDASQISEGLNHLYTLTGQNSRISKLSFSNNGKLMAAASLDGSVQMWVVNELDNLPLVFKDHEDHVWDINFNPAGNYLVAGIRSGDIKLWPTKPEMLSDMICNKLMRNMTHKEWERYVAKDITYRKTCEIASSE